MVRITLNGKDIKLDSKQADGTTLSRKNERQALLDICLRNVDSDTAAKACKVLDAAVYAAGLQEAMKSLPEDSTLEFFETPESKGAIETLKAQYSVKNLVNRILTAASQSEREGKIFVEKAESTSTKGATQVITSTWD